MKNKISISAGFCLVAAAAILLLPLPWLLAMITAALIHELCHLIAIRILADDKAPLSLSAWNAMIYLPELSTGKELFCALAGPFGGFLLLPFAPYWPELAMCAMAQSLYNLLPIFPLDGGRAVRCLCSLLLPPMHAALTSEYLEALSIGILLALGLYATFFLHLGPVPVLLSLSILRKSRKTPCKQRDYSLQ